MFNVSYLDRWIYGVRAIGELANIRDENGDVDIPKVRYGLAKGHLDGEKYGRIWRSTPRRILPKSAVNKGTQQEAASSPSSG